MPADHASAAAALSVSSPERPSSPTQENSSGTGPAPPWAQRPHRASVASRRQSRGLYNNNGGGGSKQALATRVIRTVSSISRQLWTIFLRLPRIQQAGVLAAATALLAASVLFLVYSHVLFTWLASIAKSWRALPGGWVIIWLMAFASAFPPLMGYSTAMTLSGMVYGFPLGWPIAASATVAGSTVSFLTSRGVFSGYVQSLVGTDKRFVALGQVLRRDGLLVLTGVRFCPLPYSLSNGFLATIPSIQAWKFALATAFVSPKLLIHVFIGSRLALLAEQGDSMSTSDKLINYASMALGGVVGAVVGLVVYRRTMARAEELTREQQQQQQQQRAGGGSSDGRQTDDGYADSDSGEQSGLLSAVLMDPAEAEAAALMDEDDISLWGADDYELDRPSAHRFVDDEEAAVEGDGRGFKR